MDKKQTNQDIYEAAMNKALQYIAENLEKNLSLPVIAAQANMSPYHFHRVFKQLKGITPRRYITEKRIEKAAVLIEGTHNLFLNEIAELCGFSTQTIFLKAFKDYYGITPHEYRKKFEITGKLIHKNKKGK